MLAVPTQEFREDTANQDGTGTGNGDSCGPQISADGSTVAFMSDASDLVQGDANGTADLFVWDAVHGVRLIPLRPVGEQGRSWQVDPYPPAARILDCD